MGDILVFCENDSVSYEMLSWAGREKGNLNAKVSAAILGKGAKEKAANYFAYGADKVYLAVNDELNDFYADVYAEALTQLINTSGANLILIGSTRRGKELAPRVAQKLGAGYVANSTESKLRMATRKLTAIRLEAIQSRQ